MGKLVGAVLGQRGDDREHERRGGQASGGEPEHDRPIDVVRHMVAPAAGGFGDRGIEQVGADGDLRGHPERRNEDRSHQRAATDAGQPDEQPDCEADPCQWQQMCRPRKIDHWVEVPSPRAGIIPRLAGFWNFFRVRFR